MVKESTLNSLFEVWTGKGLKRSAVGEGENCLNPVNTA